MSRENPPQMSDEHASEVMSYIRIAERKLRERGEDPIRVEEWGGIVLGRLVKQGGVPVPEDPESYSPRNYILSAMRNQARSYHSQRRAQAAKEFSETSLDAMPYPDSVAADPRTPEDILAEQPLAMEWMDPGVVQALNSLYDTHRNILLMRAEGLDVNETAEAAGVAPGTVMSGTSRAKANMAAMLSEPPREA